jgi:hypothetical protein
MEMIMPLVVAGILNGSWVLVVIDSNLENVPGSLPCILLILGVEVTGPTTGDCMWHHMAATKTGNTLSIYIDGQWINDFTGTFPPGSRCGFNIGSWVGASGNFWPGQIDEVRIWGFAKSQMQIQNEMNIELQGTEPGLLAYYPMNQGVASGDNGSGCPSGMPCEDILQDVTGNGFDGVLQILRT